MPGVAALKSTIAAADNSGDVTWTGTGQLEDILNTAADLLATNGVKVVANLSDLSALGIADCGCAVVLSTGFFAYNATATVPVVSPNVAASGGGMWVYVCQIGATIPTTFTQVLGDNVSTVFTITHNLNTLFPWVQALVTSGGLPYGALAYTYQVVSANAITATFSPALGANEVTIAIKK